MYIMDIEWLTGAIGVGLGAFLTTGASAFFNKKRDKADTQAVQIENLAKTVEVYQHTIDSLNQEIQDLKAEREEWKVRHEEMEQRFQNLKDIVYEVLDNTCLDQTCTARKKFTNKKVQEILDRVKDV